MKNALGLIEIRGLATAVLVADTMVKTADVTIIQIEKARGHGWITVKITGDVAAVNAAVSAGKQVGETFQHYISSKVIPRPADSVERVFCQTEKKEDGTTPPDQPEPPAPKTPEPEPEPEVSAAQEIPEEKPEEPLGEPSVPQTEEPVPPEPAQEAAAVPVQEAVLTEPETVLSVEEVLLPEPEAVVPEQENPAPVSETIQRQAKTEGEAPAEFPAKEEKPQDPPAVSAADEPAVSQPEAKAKPSGRTGRGKSAAAGSTGPKNTVVKEKGTKQTPRKPRAKKEK
ncbi:BMC domain-containing protein [Caproiciproducens sp. R1]|uniref:BMC domain-containing protein n=1 Tax=Caproiciproducens sp. R1 TaxID=3435000 RepID=UPI0040334A4F